jgi:tetratricopeptide (TPR) repeat protein
MRLRLFGLLSRTVAICLITATTMLGAVSHRAYSLVSTSRLFVPRISIPRGSLTQANRENEVAMLISRGEDLNNQGSYNEAVKEFQKALEIDAHNSHALFRMGESEFKLRNLQGALNVLREALTGDLRPEWIEVWANVNIGKILDLRGQRERAVLAYQKAVDTHNDSYGAQVEAEKYLKEPFRGINFFWPAPLTYSGQIAAPVAPSGTHAICVGSPDRCRSKALSAANLLSRSVCCDWTGMPNDSFVTR